MAVSTLADALPGALKVAATALRSLSTAATAPSDLEEHVAGALYQEWYCGASDGPDALANSGRLSMPVVPERDLTDQFRAAHAGTTRWESGWMVSGRERRDHLAVGRGREQRIVHAVDCLHATEAHKFPEVGDDVLVVARRDSLAMNPGDWVTFSEHWPGCREPLLRLYWNLDVSGAAACVGQATTLLDPDLPWLLKCPRRASEYARRDAVVLYLPRIHFEPLRPVIGRLYTEVRASMRGTVPPLTLELAPGLSLAEDPGEPGESFGTHRCRITAHGIIRAWSGGQQESSAWADAVHEAFAAAGIDADRPHLAGPNEVDYRL